MWWLIPIGTFAFGVLVGGVWLLRPDQPRKPRYDSPYAQLRVRS